MSVCRKLSVQSTISAVDFIIINIMYYVGAMEEDERYQRILDRFQDFMKVEAPSNQINQSLIVVIVRVDTSLLP